MASIYQKNYIVPESDVNLAKHVDNQVYLRWMLDIAFEHVDDCGWSVQKQVELGQCFYVKSHFIEYLAPVFEGDSLIFLTWLSAVEQKRATRHYRFFKTGNTRPLLKAETQWVFVDMPTGKPTDIPDPMKMDFRPVSEQEVQEYIQTFSA